MRKLLMATLTALMLAGTALAQGAVAQLQGHGTVWFAQQGASVHVVAHFEGLKPHSVHRIQLGQHGELGTVVADAEGRADMDLTLANLNAGDLVGRSVGLDPDGIQASVALADAKTMQGMNRVPLGSVRPVREAVGVPYVDVRTDKPRVEDPHPDLNLQNLPIDGTKDRKFGPNDDIRDFPLER